MAQLVTRSMTASPSKRASSPWTAEVDGRQPRTRHRHIGVVEAEQYPGMEPTRSTCAKDLVSSTNAHNRMSPTIQSHASLWQELSIGSDHGSAVSPISLEPIALCFGMVGQYMSDRGDHAYNTMRTDM